jgi:phage tail-like protein
MADEITAHFRIQGPNLEIDSFTVGQSGVRAGRSGDNDLVLASSEISRHHMRFEWVNGEIAVRDLNSSNGIWFGEERVRPDQAQVLKPNDSIRVGPFTITLDHISTPKKKKAVAGTVLDLPAQRPAEPAPPPAEPIPPVAEEPYVPKTAPPVEEPVPAEALVTMPPPSELAPPPEPAAKPSAERPSKADKPKEKASEAAQEEKSFLFQPVRPDEQAPVVEARQEAESVPPVAEVPAPPPVELKPVEPKITPKSDDPFDRIQRIGGDGASLSPEDPLPPLPSSNGMAYPVGIPRDSSTWMKYLPSIYLDDDFVGRFLLIFEAMMSPAIWTIDNLELYYSPEMAPLEWVRWISEWFDITIPSDLPPQRQRAIMSQLGWLAKRRGTRVGLERLIELFCGVRPEITETSAHFTVKLTLSEADHMLSRETIDRLIMANKPAYASYTLEIT